MFFLQNPIAYLAPIPATLFPITVLSTSTQRRIQRMHLLNTRRITLTRPLGPRVCRTPAPHSERRRLSTVLQGRHASQVWMSCLCAGVGDSFSGLCDFWTAVASMAAVVSRGCAGRHGRCDVCINACGRKGREGSGGGVGGGGKGLVGA